VKIDFLIFNLVFENLKSLLLKRFGDLRHSLEQVGNQAQVGHLKYGRIGVFVYGNNCLAVLHACFNVNFFFFFYRIEAKTLLKKNLPAKC
jgi:hypothetical protein